jgi:folate-binding protein YgfZ
MTLSISTAQPSIDLLPENYAIYLSEISAIKLSGQDKSPYLQGQITCDVNASDQHSLMPGAHCDAKGKTLSVFRFINRLDEHLLIQPKSCLATSLAQLQKFGVFAKVDISASDDLGFYALLGPQSKILLQQTFAQTPDESNPVIQCEGTTLVFIAGQQPSYLLIDQLSKIEQVIAQFSLPVYCQAVWDLIEINAGFPILATENVAEFVPQMLNLQALNGISFTKGCYLGQETVARMQYLGKNKRALFTLSGSTSGSQAVAEITSGAIIEQRLGENWRKAGVVLKAYQGDNRSVMIQAVLNKDLDDKCQLRVKNQIDTQLAITPLPYLIAE